MNYESKKEEGRGQGAYINYFLDCINNLRVDCTYNHNNFSKSIIVFN